MNKITIIDKVQDPQEIKEDELRSIYIGIDPNTGQALFLNKETGNLESHTQWTEIFKTEISKNE